MFKNSVRVALDAVADMAADDPLRSIAFQEVLRASLAGATTSTFAAVVPSRGRAPEVPGPNAEDPSTRLAQRFGLERDVVHRVIDFEGEAPTLTVSASRFPAAKAAATQQIALLVCAARQGGGLETETAADVIRRACEEFGRYDESNFAATLRQIGESLIPGGTARARTYRLSRPGYERARGLVETLTSQR